jgi:hypothetical protein
MHWIGIMLGLLLAMGALLGALVNARDARRWREHEEKREEVKALVEDAFPGHTVITKASIRTLVRSPRNEVIGEVWADSSDRSAPKLAEVLVARLHRRGDRQRVPDDGPPSAVRKAVRRPLEDADPETRAMHAQLVEATGGDRGGYLRHLNDCHTAEIDQLAADEERARRRASSPRPVVAVVVSSPLIGGNHGAGRHAS